MDFTESLTIQTWVLYAIGVLLIAGRIISRQLRNGSLFRLWAEEYIMLFVVGTFTAFSWSLLEVAENGSNYMSLEQALALTPEETKQVIYGSKLTLVMEVLTLTTIWSVKGCLCLMFYRLTEKFRWENLAVRCIAVYCVVAYCLIIILLFSYWCQPFSGYWASPVQDSQCASYYHHMYFATAWNISADLMLLAIPLRIIPKLLLPLKRKVILLCVLMLGIFNILAAVLNRYYNWAHPNSLMYLRWYVGEVCTAVYVVNIPACWPLLQRLFKLGQWAQGSTNNAQPYRSDPTSYMYPSRQSRSSRPRKDFSTTATSTIDCTESEEHLAMQDAAQHWTAGSSAPHAVIPAWPVGEHSVYIASKEPEIGVAVAGDGAIVRTVEVSQEETRRHFQEDC